jgi:hypothetical protein
MSLHIPFGELHPMLAISAAVSILASLITVAWYVYQWGLTKAVASTVPVLAIGTSAAVAVAALVVLSNAMQQDGYTPRLAVTSFLTSHALSFVLKKLWRTFFRRTSPQPEAVLTKTH